jgi:cellulose biosynthesis protein BcsQ
VGKGDAITILKEARAYRDIPAFFVLNQVITGTKIAKAAVDALGEFSKDIHLLKTVLYSRVTFKNSAGTEQGVMECEKDCKAAQELRAVYAEIMRRMK